MPTHPIYGNFLASFTPMVGVSIGLPNPISGGLSDSAGMISSYNPHFFVDASSSMLGVLESTSLDLDPSNTSSLDIITATRAGTATYTDANGTIQLADPNTVRVDHVQGEELTPTTDQLITYTDFSSDWNGGEIVSGYDSSAGLYYEAVNAFSFAWTDIPVQSGKTYRLSFWAKTSRQTGSIYMYHGFVTGNQTSINSSTPLTSEWQYVELDITSDFTGDMRFGARFQFAGDNITISKPSIRTIGLDNPEYISNTTGSPKTVSATYGPRVPMILVEPAATNTMRFSESTDGYNYGSGITLETTNILAPNGQASAFRITPDGTNVTIRSGVASPSGAYTPGDILTASVWIKTDGYDYLIRVGGFFGNEAALFDTRDGSNISNESNVISASSEDYGNGWFRYKVTYTFQNTINNNFLYAGVRLYKQNAAGNPINWDATGETTGVLVYGTQFELGSVATSYIPTDDNDGGITRAKDDLVIDGSDFTNFYNQSEGTIYIETIGRELDFNYIYSISDGSDVANRIVAIYHEFNHLFVQTAGVLQGAPDAGTFIAGSLGRYAASFKENDLSVAIDGGNVVSDTTATLPTVSRLTIGARETGGEQLNGHIKRLLYWPHHSDNI